MKKIKLFVILALTIFSVACSKDKGEPTNQKEITEKSQDAKVENVVVEKAVTVL
ncbi:MAG: hypothetical protein ACRCZ9_05500 [Fusobacteriaceae bacterium]